MSEKMTREEERELLELQAMLSRLKIQAAQVKSQQKRRQEQAPSETMLNFANSASSFVSNNNLLKLAMLPARWKHRILLGGALMAWEYYRAHQNSKQVHPHNDVIDVYPDYKQLDNKQK
ncbi:hypothetical protein ACKLNO_00965 [Neisseriaceae bacterium B1]